MIKKFVLISLFVHALLFMACGNQLNTPIDESKLIPILADIHLSEALTQSERQEVRDSLNLIYYAQIFEHHGVTRKDFDSTMAVYTRNPEQFDSVYSRAERLVKTKRDSLHN